MERVVFEMSRSQSLDKSLQIPSRAVIRSKPSSDAQTVDEHDVLVLSKQKIAVY